MCSEKKIGFCAFVWREMREISFKEILSFIMIIVGVCAIWRAVEPQIDNFFKDWIDRWVNPNNELPIIISMYAIVFIGIVA